jgi:hypothetical protein
MRKPSVEKKIASGLREPQPSISNHSRPAEIAEDQSFTESLYHVSDKVNSDEDSEDQPAK